MASEGLHNLVVHWGHIEEHIRRIDPNHCSYLELLDKVCDVCLGSTHDNSGFIVSLFHEEGDMKHRVALTNDLDLKNMFATHKNTCEIHIFATLLPTPTATQKSNFQDTQLCYVHFKNQYDVCKVEELEEQKGEIMTYKRKGIKVDVGSETNWNDNSKEETNAEDDNLVEVNSVDEIEGEANTGNMSDCTDNVCDHSFEDSICDFMSMSDMEADDACIDWGKIGRKFMHGEDGKVVLERGMWFMDLNELREALGDFSFQEGFELIWEKDEEAGVIARCAQMDCTWYISAPATPNGKTYNIETYNSIHNCDMSAMNKDTNIDRELRIERIRLKHVKNHGTCKKPEENDKDLSDRRETREEFIRRMEREWATGRIYDLPPYIDSLTKMNLSASPIGGVHESRAETSQSQAAGGPQGSNSLSSNDAGDHGGSSNVGTNIRSSTRSAARGSIWAPY